MGGINTGRVVLGGLLAGLVMNIGEYIANMFVFASAFDDIMAAHNLTEPGGGAIALFLLMGFLGGIVMIWLYAAVRPRLGAGPKTAAAAGVVVWIFWYLFPTVGWSVLGMYAMDATMIMALIWGLVELGLAAVVGAWLYTEGGPAGAQASGGMRPPM